MKKATSVLIFAASAALMYAQTSVSLDKALNDSVVYFNAHIPGGTWVAVPYINGGSAGLSGYLADNLTVRLVNDSAFVVVERDKERIGEIEKEMNYQLSGNVSDETMVSIVKKLGAQVLIAGSLNKQGRQYRLELRSIDEETGRITASRVTESIRGDGAWEALLQTRIGLAFEGDSLAERDKRTLYQGVRKGGAEVRRFNRNAFIRPGCGKRRGRTAFYHNI
jgi:TolB-like protein